MASRSGATGRRSHLCKAGTPTMGGILILVGGRHPDASMVRPDERLCLARDRCHTVLRRGRVLRRLPESRPQEVRRPEGAVQVRLAGIDRAVHRSGALLQPARPEQTILSIPFFKSVDNRPCLVICAVRGAGAGRRVKRREPHRRPRRACDRAGRHSRDRERHRWCT